MPTPDAQPPTMEEKPEHQNKKRKIGRKQQPRHPQQPLELRRRGSGRRWRVERRTAPRKSVGIKNRTAGFDWHLLSIVATRPLQPCLHTCCYFSMATCTVNNHLHVFFSINHLWLSIQMELALRLRKVLKSNFWPNCIHYFFTSRIRMFCLKLGMNIFPCKRNLKSELK